jgi:hypothetical protein
MGDECGFDLGFAPRIGGAQQVKEVWVFEELPYPIGVPGRQRTREVGERLITINEPPVHCWRFRGITGDDAKLNYKVNG